MPGVGVTFGAKDTGLLAMEKEVATRAGKITTELRRAAREMAKAEQAGVRSLAKLETAGEKYRRELRNIHAALRANLISEQQAHRAIQKSAQGLRGQSAAAASIVSSAKSYLASWLGVQAAVSFVTREMQLQLSIFDKTATDTDKMADSIRRLIANVGPNVSGPQKVAFVQQLATLGQQRDVAIKPSILIGEAARLFSATTGEFEPRKDIVLRTLKQIAPLFISQPEQVGSFGGGFQAFLTTMQREGIKLKDPEVFGLFLQAQSQVRIEDIKKLTNIIPVLRAVEATTEVGAGGVPSGKRLSLADTKAVIATFARIGSEADEREGEKTRTAMIKMVKVMEERFPNLSFVGQLGAVESLSPARQQELFKPLSALRSIGFVVQAFLRDAEKKEFSTIVKELVIDADAAQVTREQMLTMMNVLVQSSATRQAEAIAEVRRSDNLASAAGARRRIQELTESEGTLGRSLIRLSSNIELMMGRDPEAVEREAIRQVFSPSRPPELSRALGLNSERLEEMTKALERLDRIYSSIAPPLNPETRGE